MVHFEFFYSQGVLQFDWQNANPVLCHLGDQVVAGRRRQLELAHLNFDERLPNAGNAPECFR